MHVQTIQDAIGAPVVKTHSLVFARVANLAARRFGLTPRETEVVSGLLDGLDNDGLARGLGCTRRTVEAHITSTLAKAGASSRLELVSLCWRAWVTDDR